MPLGAMLAAWVQTNPLGPPGRTLFRRASGARPQGLSPNQRRQLMSAKSGVDSPRKWRPPLSDRLVEMNLSVAAAVGVGILALGMAIGKRMS
jgi:hypothetical protein